MKTTKNKNYYLTVINFTFEGVTRETVGRARTQAGSRKQAIDLVRKIMDIAA